ncbi:hypothetical protein DL93DRAFT_604847 [Clavulina sp. PMI_390]|nr:hypothetical protein DL93DRAFT_604847 [Clavulina sp. PMI_390]
MSLQPFFEIDEAIYHSPKLKPGRSYRLVILWSGLDFDNKTELITRSAMPTGEKKPYQCVWYNPTAGKRQFAQAPTRITLKIQYHKLHISWQDTCTFQWECSKIVNTGEIVLDGSKTDHQLVIKAAVVHGDIVPSNEVAASIIPGLSNLTANTPSTPPSDPLVHANVAHAVEAAIATVPAHTPTALMTAQDKLSENVEKIAPFATAITTGFPKLLVTLEQVMRISNLVAQVVKANADLCARFQGLVEALNYSCTLTAEYAQQKNDMWNIDTAVQALLQEVVQGSHVVIAYGRAYNQRLSAIKNYFSSLQQDIQGCMDRLQSLQVKLSQHTGAATLNQVNAIHKGVERLNAKEDFKDLQYSEKADMAFRRHALDSGCLPGTRTDVLSAIVVWASGGTQLPDCPAYLQSLDTSKSVLWICGVAGSGKSSIAMSVAQSLDGLGLLGAFYGFSATNQAELHPTTLFATLALQLAERDSNAQQKLLSILERLDGVKCKSLSPAQQLEMFLLPLLCPADTALSHQHTSIVIDALDESGTDQAHSEVLQLLAKIGPRLPPTIHILITSRFEPDVQKTLHTLPAGTILLQMSLIPQPSTEHDIHLYVHHMLKDTFEVDIKEYAIELTQLAMKAEQSFQWAATACRYIKNGDATDRGISAETRLNTVLCSKVVKSKHPQAEAKRVVHLLGSLVAGTGDPKHALVPLHTSFTDFLQDVRASGPYAVDVDDSHAVMASGCFQIMSNPQSGLRFNICQLATSFELNSEVDNLASLIQEHIGEALSYACCCWPAHINALPNMDSGMIKGMEQLLSTQQLFYWLEVMSLTGTPPGPAIASLNLQKDQVCDMAL